MIPTEQNAEIVGQFVFTAPLAGWQWVSVREHRTAVDGAEEVRILLEEDFPDAEKIILICTI